MDTDTSLFRRIAHGDEEAFTTIFFRYTARLAPFITQMLQSENWAEEILQDVFMRLWQNRHLLEEVEHPSAYLYRMASNQTLTYMKRNAQEVKLQYYAARHAAEGANNTESDLDFRETDTFLKEAVNNLPPQRRKVFQLAREQGLSHAEIAGQLGISRHTVRNHVAEALQEIRQYLRAKGVVAVLALCLLYFPNAGREQRRSITDPLPALTS